MTLAVYALEHINHASQRRHILRLVHMTRADAVAEADYMTRIGGPNPGYHVTARPVSRDAYTAHAQRLRVERRWHECSDYHRTLPAFCPLTDRQAAYRTFTDVHADLMAAYERESLALERCA